MASETVNLLETSAPKSDQLNVDNFVGGPITIKITGIRKGSAEQKVIVDYEDDNGRPWKPCTTMQRALITIWRNGDNPQVYIGRRLMLFCDPEVTYGPQKTGGIRIAGASHIPHDMTITVTVRRGVRKTYVIKKLPDDDPGLVPADPGKSPVESALDKRAREAAERGVAALEGWWNMLSGIQRREMKPSIDKFKEIARQVDADAAGQMPVEPEDDDGEPAGPTDGQP